MKILGSLYKVYTNSKYMAQDIRECIRCYFSKANFGPIRKTPSEIDVSNYIIGLFDIDENRKLVFGKGKMAATFRETLFGKGDRQVQTKELFVKALTTHDGSTYEPLLKEIM